MRFVIILVLESKYTKYIIKLIIKEILDSIL